MKWLSEDYMAHKSLLWSKDEDTNTQKYDLENLCVGWLMPSHHFPETKLSVLQYPFTLILKSSSQ
jgi:hypothetical protein